MSYSGGSESSSGSSSGSTNAAADTVSAVGAGALAPFRQMFGHLAEHVQAEVKQTTPQEWGIAGGISLVLCLLYQAITKSKDEGSITFSVILYAVVLTFVAVIVRVKTFENQFAWSVVCLNIVGLLFSFHIGAALLLGGVPVLINRIRQQLADVSRSLK